jgi:hypothetical protein
MHQAGQPYLFLHCPYRSDALAYTYAIFKYGFLSISGLNHKGVNIQINSRIVDVKGAAEN